MKKHIIIATAIILAVAAIAVTAVLLSRDPATGTLSQSDDGQGGTAAGGTSGSNVGQDSGSDGGQGTGGTGTGQDAGAAEGQGAGAAGGDSASAANEADVRDLNIYSYDSDLAKMVKAYAQRHPEFNYNVKGYLYSQIDDHHTLSKMNENMQSEGPDVVDIYCVPYVFSHEVIMGEYSKHACTYKELGIDVDAALKKADIPQHIIDAGTNPDGEIIALPYITGANVFLYRRSVAKAVWGTDEPDKIAGIIGAGTEKWDRFLEAAQTLKEHGCYIVPRFCDVSNMIDTSLAASFTKSDENGEINPKWLEFMDVAKKMLDNGYFQPIREYYWWSGEWIDAMKGKGEKPVLGYIISYDYIGYLLRSDILLNSTDGDWAICLPPFNSSVSFYTGIMVNKDSPNKDALGPLIEWLTLDCSETGLQYILANDKLVDKNSQQYVLNGGKRAVISRSLLKNTECSVDLLGGQNINPVIYDALNAPTGRHDGEGIEWRFFNMWLEETEAYIHGEKDRETAVADYKKAEKETISWYKKIFEEYGISFLLPE